METKLPDLPQRRRQGAAGRGPTREEPKLGSLTSDKEPAGTQSWAIHQALRNRAFWVIFSAQCLGFIAVSLASVHLVPYATDVDISTANAATALGLMGAMMIPSGIVAGFAAQRFGWREVLIVSYLLMASGAVLILQLKALWMLYTYVIIFGLGQGSRAPAQAGIVGTYFGTGSSLGTLSGILIGGPLVAGGILGPYLGGILFDATHSYFIAVITMLIALLISSVLIATTHPPVVVQDTCPGQNNGDVK